MLNKSAPWHFQVFHRIVLPTKIPIIHFIWQVTEKQRRQSGTCWCLRSSVKKVSRAKCSINLEADVQDSCFIRRPSLPFVCELVFIFRDSTHLSPLFILHFHLCAAVQCFLLNVTVAQMELLGTFNLTQKPLI